nr:5-formyltetrahydrofolate cyclo-ligase [Helicobacter cinaedi]
MLSLYPKKGLIITKQDFRKVAKAFLGYKTRYASLQDRALNPALFRILRQKGAKNVLVYMPFGNEVNIFPLISTLRKKKYRVFVPYIQEFYFKMIPLRMPLQKNVFGIYESNNSTFNLIKVDAVIIPVLGIDKDFRRIGFGKGMYDRFMSCLKKKVYVIFVARSPNYTPSVITESYDVQGDCFVTPSALCLRKHNGSMVCHRRYNLRVIGGRECVSYHKKDF